MLLSSYASLETHPLSFWSHCRLQLHRPHLAILLVELVWIVGALPHLKKGSLLVDTLLKEGGFVHTCGFLYLHSFEEGRHVGEFLGDCPHEIIAEKVYLAVH